jgi:hypothetical protein
MLLREVFCVGAKEGERIDGEEMKFELPVPDIGVDGSIR